MPYEEMIEYLLSIPHMKPKKGYEREYLILAGRAEEIYKKLRTMKNMELPEEIELPSIENGDMKELQRWVDSVCVKKRKKDKTE